MSKIRVLIADDDQALAAALADTIAAAPDLELASVATEADGAVAAASVHRPDVVLMDVKMPGGGGIEATRRIVSAMPTIAVVGLSAHEDQGTALQMLEAGAVGYVVKGMPEDEILDAVRRARRGQLSLPVELGLGAFRDLIAKVREYEKSESERRSSEERIRALVDAMPDALVIVDDKGEIELANAPTQRMFGYGPAELVGLAVEVLIPERHRAVHETMHTRFRQHPKPRPMGSGLNLLGRRKDGTEFPVDISLSPLPTGRGLAVVAAIRDVTEQRESEDVRRKNEQLFRGLLESAPDAMVVVDAHGRIQIVNSRVEQLFGYSREQLLGRIVDELVPDAFRAGHAGHRAKYLSNPGVRPMGQGLELFGRRRDGSEFPVDISLSPMRTVDGLLIIAAVRDITDRKTTEKRLAQTQEIADRRRLMTHLVQVQEEERRKIAADIHDDSIQAMTATSLRLQQLRKHLTDPAQREVLTKLDDAVRESIVRLRRLMFDLRPPALDRTGLAAALRELLERIKTETGLEYRLDDRLSSEPAGDVRIEMFRIAQEALVNVRKHASAGHVRVELQRVEHGNHVRITDDGRGFEGDTAAAQPGHLGLVAMRERAQIAGGWWTVESRKGVGTTVDFWLPDDRDGAGQAPE
jgi:PAS domain S-box-containing protein